MFKGLLLSKTFWFNVITLGMAVFQLYTKTYMISNQDILFVNGVGNIFLRMITGQPLGKKRSLF